MHYNRPMMINSTLQLNKFIALVGVKSHDELLPKLIENKEIISFELAKLVLSADKLSARISHL